MPCQRGFFDITIYSFVLTKSEAPCSGTCIKRRCFLLLSIYKTVQRVLLPCQKHGTIES